MALTISWTTVLLKIVCNWEDVYVFGQGEIQGSQEEGTEEDTPLSGARPGARSRGVSTCIVPLIHNLHVEC